MLGSRPESATPSGLGEQQSDGPRASGRNSRYVQHDAEPCPITNEVAILLVLLTTGGVLVFLVLLAMAWLEGHPSAFSTIGLGTGPMLGALAVATLNAALRRGARKASRLDPETRGRRYRALDWLEWTTIVLCTGLVVAALNTALPAASRILNAGL
ncbi:hypothetical protein H0Z60_02350 [Ectothiorhodospiraceae bacterium WFHF3C12]|nr:hypothetical protein [Ectothiorhodospiraceae bacterium WFHF3C12]